MPPGAQKRHHPRPHGTRYNAPSSGSATQPIPPSAYIRAYEAQLVRDPELAEEVVSKDSRRGVGIIQYAGEVDYEDGSDKPEIWADRYDILHLLSSVTIPRRTLPAHGTIDHGAHSFSVPASPASSSSSWDSIPSDMEETFHLSDPAEMEAYEIDKKRKWMEALREQRLREREKEDRAVQSGSAAKGKWKDDEEPPAAVKATMQHTALALSSSPNPSVLELRILTNHSTDARFEFLRGRYRDTWEQVKKELRSERESVRRAEEKKKGLGGLMGYDSGDDEDEEEEIPPPPPPPPEDDDLPPPPPPAPDEIVPPPPPATADDSMVDARGASLEDDEEEKKRLRRIRAEEWKRKRANGGG